MKTGATCRLSAATISPEKILTCGTVSFDVPAVIAWRLERRAYRSAPSIAMRRSAESVTRSSALRLSEPLKHASVISNTERALSVRSQVRIDSFGIQVLFRALAASAASQ